MSIFISLRIQSKYLNFKYAFFVNYLPLFLCSPDWLTSPLLIPSQHDRNFESWCLAGEHKDKEGCLNHFNLVILYGIMSLLPFLILYLEITCKLGLDGKNVIGVNAVEIYLDLKSSYSYITLKESQCTTATTDTAIDRNCYSMW